MTLRDIVKRGANSIWLSNEPYSVNILMPKPVLSMLVSSFTIYVITYSCSNESYIVINQSQMEISFFFCFQIVKSCEH